MILVLLTLLKEKPSYCKCYKENTKVTTNFITKCLETNMTMIVIGVMSTTYYFFFFFYCLVFKN
jgi:hypothetical protein